MIEFIGALLMSWLRIALTRKAPVPTIHWPANPTTWAAFGVALITALYQAFVVHDFVTAAQTFAGALAILGIGGTASATHADTQSLRNTARATR